MYNDAGAHRTLKRIPNWLAVGFLLGLTASSVVAAQSDSSIAARLQALEDRAAIEELITSGYSTAIDMRDWKGLAALFTQDAEFNLFAKQFPPRIFKGRAAIEKALSPSDMPPPDASEFPGGMPVSMKHVITNPRVRLNGDRATATAYWMEVAIMKDGSSRVAATGYYSDVLKRDGRDWKFQTREVFAYDMSAIGGAEPVTSPPAPAQR